MARAFLRTDRGVAMDVSAVQKKLETKFRAAIGPVESGRLESWIEVDAAVIDRVAEALKSDSELAFDCLSNLTAADYPHKSSIQIVYNLFSYRHKHELTIKVNLPRATPTVKTVERVWPAANWMEREAYDLHGVVFEGHSDLRRILLPDDWIGYPLRKDYVEAPEYHGISTIRESMLDLPGRS